MRKLGIALAAALLTGCATAPSEQVCPPQRGYAREFQRAAAAQLPQAAPEHRVLIEDYGALRAWLRGAGCPAPPAQGARGGETV